MTQESRVVQGSQSKHPRTGPGEGWCRSQGCTNQALGSWGACPGHCPCVPQGGDPRVLALQWKGCAFSMFSMSKPSWSPKPAWNGWMERMEPHFLGCSSFTSHPRAVPPMSHPISPSGPNIAPKAEEGAALCALGRRAREGPRHPTLLHPGPRSRPEPQPSRTPSHQRWASRGVGKERVPQRRRDRFLLGECGTRSRGQRIGQGGFPLCSPGDEAEIPTGRYHPRRV